MAIPLSKIKMLAPGTKLRKSLDDILGAKFGALIVFIDEKTDYESFVQGGFRFDINFAPEKLYELAKMDGGVILDQDGGRILGANVHLVPDSSMPTVETGMRHRTAERIARQTGFLVLAISSRRNVVTLYYENNKYVMNDIKLLLARVTQALYTLEKYRVNFDKMLTQIELAELHNRAELRNIIEVLIKGVEIQKIRDQIEPYVIELGTEGNLFRMQLEEIVGDLDELLGNFLKDYHIQEVTYEEAQTILGNLKKLKELGPLVAARSIGFDLSNISQLDETTITARGYRVLKYAVGLPMTIVVNLIKTFKNIYQISNAKIDVLKEVEGIGDKRAITIFETLENIKKGNIL